MMKPKKKLLLFIAACLFPFLAVSFSPLQTEALPDSASKQEQLDDFIQEYVDKLVLPGLSIAISHKGELIYSQTFGDGLETESRFYIGSTTKPFTALAIMQLVEQRRIKLDNSVSVYLPDFTVSDDITIRHLLHHVSGMSEFDYIAKLPDHAIFTELIDDMNTMTLTYKPGSEFAYFNQNYSLLGGIIERVSGKTYPEYITEHILEPLQLKNTTLTGKVDLPGNMSFFGVPVKRTEPFKVYDLPAGYMTSTAEDVVAFLDAISLSKPELGISPEGVAEMLDGNSSYYGMGWIVTDVAGRPAVHHGGSLPGYSSEAIILTEDQYSISYLINKNHLLNGMVFHPDFTNGIISILMDEEPSSKANYYWVVRILLLAFVATLLFNFYNSVKMIKEPEDLTSTVRWRKAILNLIIPVGIILLIPIFIPYILGRGMTWELAFLLVPDFVAWLFLGVLIHLSESVIHFYIIRKQHFTNRHLSRIIH